jgi:uncharacterized protein YkwD
MVGGMALLPHIRRTFAAAALAILGILAAATLLPAAPAHASGAVVATTASEENDFLVKANYERSRRGLPKMVWDSKLASTSRSWSSHMASEGRISHTQNLAQIASNVDPGWRSAGENVGVGYTVQSLHDAFMASTGHRENLLKRAYNRVGIGVVHSGGRIWVTFRFIEGTPISGSTGTVSTAPTPAPGVKTALTGDFDGDGIEDLLTYNPGTTGDELWFGEADGTMRKGSVNVNGHYRPVAGDFDGDGLTQVIWYAPGTFSDYIWEWNGSGWNSQAKSIDGTYRPLVGDFEGDGNDDVLWYAPGTARDAYWYGNDTGSFTTVRTEINGRYNPKVGDLDANGGDDLFWYAPGTADDYVWYSTLRRGGYSGRATEVNGTYKPFTGDFDGNGSDDVFWYAPGTARDYVWYHDGTKGGHTTVARTVARTYVPGAGDFDGDSADDIVWFSPSSAGGDPMWYGTDGEKTYSPASVSS